MVSEYFVLEAIVLIKCLSVILHSRLSGFCIDSQKKHWKMQNLNPVEKK